MRAHVLLTVFVCVFAACSGPIQTASVDSAATNDDFEKLERENAELRFINESLEKQLANDDTDATEDKLRAEIDRLREENKKLKSQNKDAPAKSAASPRAVWSKDPGKVDVFDNWKDFSQTNISPARSRGMNPYEALNSGEIGMLGFFGYDVRKVLDDSSAILSIRYFDFVITGVDTSRISDNLKVSVDGVWEVVGTSKIRGSTLFVLEARSGKENAVYPFVPRQRRR